MILKTIYNDNQTLKDELIDKGLDSRLVNLLVNRGYKREIIEALLETGYSKEMPSTDTLINVEVGADIIESHIANNSNIYIFGDYDSDGCNSTYILGDAINYAIYYSESNATINLKVPERHEGYGLNMEWCKQIVANKTNDTLVITVDNGIAQDREVEYLLENGIDVLITDHHTPNGHTPQNVWIIDPHFNNDDINNKGLCGAGVAFKLAMTLLYRYDIDENTLNSLYYKYLIHVAIATITDSMPMTVENIQFVYNGVQLLKDGYASDAIDYYREFNANTDLTPKDIAFGLGPQINSCGRMNNTQLALQYLFSEAEEVEDIYNKIVQTNDDRKAKTKESIAIAEKQVSLDENTFVTVLNNVEGIAGIIASDISSRYNRPTIIFSESNDKKYLIGSARSAMGIDLLTVLRSLNTDAIVKVGGHSGACGITIKANGYKEVKDLLENTISDIISNMSPVEDDNEIEIVVDDMITVADINKETCDSLKDLYFFTNSNPVFAMEAKIIKTKASKNNSNNVEFSITDGESNLSFWSWGIGEQYNALGKPTDVVFIGEVEYKFGKPSFNILNIIPKGEIEIYA